LKLVNRFIFAVSILTRLPLPVIKFDAEEYGRSTSLFPLVGLLLGRILALFNKILILFPAEIKASFLVLLTVVLTGGIHLDGFIDSIDGLLGGESRERKLEIMRDSRVGAFGVAFGVCLLLLKYSLFLSVTQSQSSTQILLIVPALSRWGMSYSVATFPYARKEGLGRLFSVYSGTKELVFSTSIALILAYVILGTAGLFLLALTALVVFFTGKKIVGALGGLTGDIYGFINELLEVILLFTAYTFVQSF